MRIDVVLRGALRSRAPDGNTSLDLPDHATAQAILPALGLPSAHCVYVVNGQPVNGNTELRPGARVEVFPPMAGGA